MHKKTTLKIERQNYVYHKFMERSSNFELLRICCMLMIISGHIIGAHDTPFSLENPDEIIKLFFYGGFLVAANTFVIISGYFGIKFRKERLISLVLQVIFYSVALLIFAIAIGWHTFLPKKDFMLFFPILFKQYWFITCYVMLYIISPLLNKWAGSLNKNDYKKLLSTGFLIIYVWPTLSFLVNAPQFINDAGYGIVNFSYLYMLGYYIRHYYSNSRQFVSNRLIYWGGYFSVVIALFLFQSGLSWILGFEFTSWFSYNTVFIFIGAVCFFMAFKNIEIHSSFINKLAISDT